MYIVQCESGSYTECYTNPVCLTASEETAKRLVSKLYKLAKFIEKANVRLKKFEDSLKNEPKTMLVDMWLNDNYRVPEDLKEVSRYLEPRRYDTTRIDFYYQAVVVHT